MIDCCGARSSTQVSVVKPTELLLRTGEDDKSVKVRFVLYVARSAPLTGQKAMRLLFVFPLQATM